MGTTTYALAYDRILLPADPSDTQAPPVRLISPQDGDELLDAESVRFSARTVSPPRAHEGGAPLDCYVTIGQGR